MYKIKPKIKLFAVLTSIALASKYSFAELPVSLPFKSFNDSIINNKAEYRTDTDAQKNLISVILKDFSDSNIIDNQSVQLINTAEGIINISTAVSTNSATAMYVSTAAGSQNNIKMINEGSIYIEDSRKPNVSSTPTNSIGMSALSSDGSGNYFELQNDGVITVTAIEPVNGAGAVGMMVSAASKDTVGLIDRSLLTNNGLIDVNSSSSNAWGMRQFSSWSALLGTIVNNGVIKVNSDAVNSFGVIKLNATGIYSDVNGSPGSELQAINNGKIYVTATGIGGEANGIYSFIDPTLNIGGIKTTQVNNNLIEVTSTGKDGVSSGMKSGAIVEAKMPYSSFITNGEHGVINSIATGENGKAYGIQAVVDSDVDVLINNTGAINTIGSTAHQLYVTSSPYTIGNKSGSAYIQTWNINLYDRESNNQSVFAVAEQGRLNFGTKDGSGAHFILRPGDKDKGYENNKHFNIQDMIKVYGDKALVSGYIGSVSTPISLLKANHGLIDTGGPLNWTNQWVSLDVSPEDGDNNVIDAGVVDNMRNQAESVGQILATSRPPSGQADINNDVQLKIYYANNRRFGIGASITDSVGTVAYTNFDVTENATLGWHAGLETSHLRARSGLLDIDSLSAVFGVQGRYDFTGNSYVRAQATGIFARNKNYFKTNEGDSDQQSTTNTGFYGTAIWGYEYNYNMDNTLTPEIGLTTLLTHSPDINVRYNNGDDLDQSYDAQNYVEAGAVAGIRWSGSRMLNNTEVRPTFYMGAKHLLTDGKIKSGLNFMDEHYTTYINSDKTSAVIDAGISTPVNKSFDIGINYRGSYSKNQIVHVGYINGTLFF